MDERLKDLETEKQNALNENNNVYDSILKDNEHLYDMNRDYVTEYRNTQDEILQKQLENELKKIEQQKQEAQHNFEQESIKAKNSYEGFVNPYNAQNERLANAGLNNSGLGETTKLGAYTTYQNRVSNANKVLQNAFNQYNLAMDDARLNNDVQKAQNALKALEMNIDFANSFYNNKANYSISKLNFDRDTDKDYYSRYQDIINQINYEKEQAEKIRQYNEQFAYQKDRDKVADSQWEKEYELSKKKISSSSSSSSSSSKKSSNNSGGVTLTNNSSTSLGNNSETQKKSDYYFSGTTQPKYIDNTKLEYAGVTADKIGVSGNGIGANYRIWQANGKQYVWNSNSNTYLDVTDEYFKYSKQKTNGLSALLSPQAKMF